MQEERLLQLGHGMLESLPLFWTFVLLSARFTGLMLLLPGIGQGLMGLAVRFPAVMVLAFASLDRSNQAALPANILDMAIFLGAEVLLGLAIGLIPLIVVAGAQTAGQLASTAMGLAGAQLFDPTAGGPLSDISRIMGDLVVILFLLLDGHHVAVYAASGLGGEIAPGSFVPGAGTTELLVRQTAAIFWAGVMLSAPAVVALLLTQFVMGLISKAVPTVNIFIISFPLTIGIGLILTILTLPEMSVFIERELMMLEPSVKIIASEAKGG